MLLCQGTVAGGYSFFMKDGKLVYVHNYVGQDHFKVESADRGAPRGSTTCASSSNRPAS